MLVNRDPRWAGPRGPYSALSISALGQVAKGVMLKDRPVLRVSKLTALLEIMTDFKTPGER